MQLCLPAPKGCECTLCRARALRVDPLALYFGLESPEGRLVLEHPGEPAYWYEAQTGKAARVAAASKASDARKKSKTKGAPAY